LAGRGVLERLLDGPRDLDRTLDLLARAAPGHQDTSPTVAGSPSANATSPSGNTGPSRQTRAFPCEVTTTHARRTPIAQPWCCSTAICASRSAARPGAAGARSASSRMRPIAASIGQGPQAQSWSAQRRSSGRASVTRPPIPKEPSSVVVTYSTLGGRRSDGQRYATDRPPMRSVTLRREASCSARTRLRALPGPPAPRGGLPGARLRRDPRRADAEHGAEVADAGARGHRALLDDHGDPLRLSVRTGVAPTRRGPRASGVAPPPARSPRRSAGSRPSADARAAAARLR